MKLRYLTLSGLLIITLGCLLPFEIQDGSVHRLFPSWFIPILGIIFLLMSKDGTFGNGRVLGGLFGLLMGTITALFLLHRDTTHIPHPMGRENSNFGRVFRRGARSGCGSGAG
jgi:hypothetical protein